jgi:hypothetical protein
VQLGFALSSVNLGSGRPAQSPESLIAQSPESRDIPTAGVCMMCGMRHKYLLRHPVGFGVIASLATADLLKRFLSSNSSSVS